MSEAVAAEGGRPEGASDFTPQANENAADFASYSEVESVTLEEPRFVGEPSGEPAPSASEEVERVELFETPPHVGERAPESADQGEAQTHAPEAPAPSSTAEPAELSAPPAEDPARPRRSGWWQRARASIVGN